MHNKKNNRILSYVNTIFRATGISVAKKTSESLKSKKMNKNSFENDFFSLRENFCQCWILFAFWGILLYNYVNWSVY